MLSTPQLAQKLYLTVSAPSKPWDALNIKDQGAYVMLVQTMCAWHTQGATPEQMAQAGHEMFKKHNPSSHAWPDVRVAWIDFAKQLSADLGAMY
jgi:hypothetical protein